MEREIDFYVILEYQNGDLSKPRIGLAQRSDL